MWNNFYSYFENRGLFVPQTSKQVNLRIFYSIFSAKNDSIIVIYAKGHENKKIPDFSDSILVAQYVRLLRS